MESAANVGAAPIAGTVRYVVDSDFSKFTVHVTARGWMSAFGHSPDIAIRKFGGDVLLDPNAIERSSLVLRIDAASLEVVSKSSDKDKREIESTMKRDVLNPDGFPEILYECSQVTANANGDGRYEVTLNGELTLHGVTRTQPVLASVALTDESLRAAGDFSVRQTDFEIKPVSALGGGLVVKDELKVNFDILARKA